MFEKILDAAAVFLILISLGLISFVCFGIAFDHFYN